MASVSFHTNIKSSKAECANLGVLCIWILLVSRGYHHDPVSSFCQCWREAAADIPKTSGLTPRSSLRAPRPEGKGFCFCLASGLPAAFSSKDSSGPHLRGHKTDVKLLLCLSAGFFDAVIFCSSLTADFGCSLSLLRLIKPWIDCETVQFVLGVRLSVWCLLIRARSIGSARRERIDTRRTTARQQIQPGITSCPNLLTNCTALEREQVGACLVLQRACNNILCSSPGCAVWQAVQEECPMDGRHLN